MPDLANYWSSRTGKKVIEIVSVNRRLGVGECFDFVCCFIEADAQNVPRISSVYSVRESHIGVHTSESSTLSYIRPLEALLQYTYAQV